MVVTCLVAQVLMWTVATPVALAADLTVDSTAADAVDTNPGDGTCLDANGACSLRAAMMELNALGGANHNILIDRSESDPQQLVLEIPDGGADTEATGDIDVATDVEIRVSPAASVDIVPGPGFDDRAFEVHPGGSIRLVGVNVRSFGAASIDGGAFHNEGTVILTCGVEVTDNTGRNGGAIHNAGLLHFRGATSVANNTADLGGNIYAAPGSTTTSQGNNGECRPNPPVHLGQGLAERGGSIYADGASVQLDHSAGFADSSATISGGVLELVGGATANMAAGEFTMFQNSAQSGGVAHVSGGASLVIDQGPVTDAGLPTTVASSSAAGDSALFHAEGGNIRLRGVMILDSPARSVLMEGTSVLQTEQVLILGEEGIDGIVLDTDTSSSMVNTYIDGDQTAISTLGTTALQLVNVTVFGTTVGIDVGAGTNVDGRLLWLYSNGTNCTATLASLVESAVDDGSCGSGGGSLIDPDVGQNTTSYDYFDFLLSGPGDNSIILGLGSTPCPVDVDLAGVERPGDNGGCEPGALEFAGSDAPPPGGDSSISGQVVRDGTLEPIAGICAIAFDDPEDEPVSFDRTAESGQWALENLAEGELIVVFYPCDEEGDFDAGAGIVPEAWENRVIDTSEDPPDFGVGDRITVGGDVASADVSGLRVCLGDDPNGGDSSCGVEASEDIDPGAGSTPGNTAESPGEGTGSEPGGSSGSGRTGGNSDPATTQAGRSPAPLAFTG